MEALGSLYRLVVPPELEASEQGVRRSHRSDVLCKLSFVDKP